MTERDALNNPDQPPARAGATVLSVAPVGRDGAEYTVTFDGAASLTLTETTVADFYLHPGKELTTGEIAHLRGMDSQQRAVETAMRAIGSRPRSTREIEDNLRGKGYAPDTIAAAVARLAARGYLDDAAFARWWTENRTQFRPRGPHLLRQELRRKGVAGDTIADTLSAQAESVDVDAQALGIARTKLRSLASGGLPPEVVTRRLSGLLARRGYGYDTVRTVLRVLKDEGALDEASEDLS